MPYIPKGAAVDSASHQNQKEDETRASGPSPDDAPAVLSAAQAGVGVEATASGVNEKRDPSLEQGATLVSGSARDFSRSMALEGGLAGGE